MKQVLLIISLSISSITFAQLGVIWDGEVQVSDGVTYGKMRPRMALTANDIPVIVYGKTAGLYVSRWNGTSFDNPVNVLPAGVQTYIANWTGPDIAAKGDTLIVVFKQYPLESGNVYSVRSTDGGITFSDTIRVDNLDNAVAWMPSLDIDQNGNPTVSYMIHDPIWSNPRYALAKSSNTGLSYTSEINIIDSIPGEACDCCPSEYVIDGNREVMLFRNNETNLRDMYAVYSNDQGSTFPYETNVDNTGWIVNSCPSTGPHGAFVNDQLVTTWTTGASGNRRVALSVSNVASGFSLLGTYTNDDPSQNRDYPRVSADGDTVVLAYKDYYGSQSDVFVSVALSSSVGDLLTNGIIACEDPAGTQTNPDIILRNGKVHLCFQDHNTNNVVYKSGSIGDVTSVKEMSMASVVIFPNPSVNGAFNLSTDQIEKIEIYNSIGQRVPFELEKYQGITKVTTQAGQFGVYQVRLTLNNGTQINKKWINN